VQKFKAMVVKHISGKSSGSTKVTGRLRGFRIIERIKYNKKVIIITSILTLIGSGLGLIIPYVFISAGIGIIIMVVIIFCFPPPVEKIVEKKEV